MPAPKMVTIFQSISFGYVCGYVLQSKILLENGICQEYFVVDIVEFFRPPILKRTLIRLSYKVFTLCRCLYKIYQLRLTNKTEKKRANKCGAGP